MSRSVASFMIYEVRLDFATNFKHYTPILNKRINPWYQSHNLDNQLPELELSVAHWITGFFSRHKAWSETRRLNHPKMGKHHPDDYIQDHSQHEPGPKGAVIYKRLRSEVERPSALPVGKAFGACLWLGFQELRIQFLERSGTATKTNRSTGVK